MCVAPAASAEEVPGPAPIAETVSAPRYASAAVPLVSYSSDTGLGLGLGGFIQRRAVAAEASVFSLEAQGFASTGGAQFHFAFLDVPKLAGGSLRLDVLAGYNRNSAAPYYGIGNHPPLASGAPAPLDTTAAANPVRRARLRWPLWRS